MARRPASPLALAVAATVLVALLAGCASRPAEWEPAAVPPSPYAVLPALASSNRSYLVEHPGGWLSISVASGGVASLALFDPEDRRVGDYRLGGGTAPSALRLDGLPAGGYVLRLLSVEGGLEVEAGNGPLPLLPLVVHVERHLLAQRSREPVPAVPFLPRDTLEVPLSIELAHAPTDLRLYSDGGFGELHLQLFGPGGEVFRSDWGRGKFEVPFFDGFDEVPGTFHPEGAAGRLLSGSLVVTDLQGSLVLEAWGESRAIPAGTSRITQQKAPATFEYGRLPGAPVAFEVSANATALLLWSDLRAPAGGDVASRARTPAVRAWVNLFDPDDRKVASVPVVAGTVSVVPVTRGGEYVAVAIAGNASLGADRPPTHLGFTLLDTVHTPLPERAAGHEGEYGQAEDPLDVEGVVFDVRPTQLFEPYWLLDPPIACRPDASVRILQAGETVGAWGATWPAPPLPAGVLLDDGPASVWHDGFGESGCPRAGALVLAYRR